MKHLNKSRTMLFFMVLLANLSAFAQNSMVGDGFGGRAGYSPVNYSSTEQGGFSICGANNQLYGWGYNLYNQLPPAASGYYDASTVAISNMTNVRQAKGALFHTAIKNDGTGWVWGTNIYSLNFPTPTQVITNAYYGDAGYSYATFVKTDGTVWTVGDNTSGVYGDGTTTSTCMGPTACIVQMPGITNAKRVSCGRDGFALILLADGTVKQVGKINNTSAFPMPPSLESYTPITVPGLSNIVDVKAGSRNAIALTASGQVYSWGYNYYTGLGLNNNGNSMPTLLTFPAGAKPIKAISNGKDYGLALDEDGNVYGWGNIYGPGINTASLILTPTLSTTGVQDIIGGYSHSYIVKTDGTMWASGGAVHIWMNLSNAVRAPFTQITPTGSPMNLCAPTAFNGMPPCVAGTTAPAVTPTTATNSCPATTVDLTSLAISSTTPSGASLIWSTHKTPTSAGDTLTTAQKTAVSTAGTYYALYYDATNACYSPADSVTITITSCVAPLSASNPAAQTATTGQAKTGNAATELAPTGGVSPYVYSNGAGDAACVAPSGATALTGLTVNSDGSYSYTAPTAAGTYYYCIKICDSATPTASCVVKTYTLTVSPNPLTASNPAAQTATTGQAKTGNAATELAPTGGVSPYTYSNGAGDAACVAPSGATALTGLTVNSNGTYSYTAPATAGTYYYCIKVCDSATPTASCVVKTYTLTVTTTALPLTANNPAAQTATTGQAKTGNAATELAPTGGVSPYVYSNGAGDAACVAPSGATALTGLTVNSDGSYSYTAPTTAGTYYYCIKVCDSATPTASCVVKTYTLTVTASCNAGTVAPVPR